jgi:Zn-finger nucleic acid-binding protein
MNCPACKSQMFVMEYDELELDHCPACEGVWFDATELALLFADESALADEAIANLADADTREARRRCPICRRTMRKVNIGPGRGVLVDVCGDGHGLFFDRGEVADLAAELQTSSDNAPARLLQFLGEAYRGDEAASETEKP